MNKENKIAIISNYSLRLCPFLKFYSDLFEANDIDYIIITKEPQNQKVSGNYTFIQTPDLLKQNIMKRTFFWYKFVLKQLKVNNCNKIVVAPTKTAIVLAPILFFKKGKYVMDIRDYTNEYSYFYKLIEKILMNRSGLITISSAGFKKWLPLTKTKMSLIHNMKYNYESHINSDYVINKDHKEAIVIAYIGLVDYFSTNVKLIDALKNNTNYKLQYSGIVSSNCKIIEYVKTEKIDNVIFTGPFNNEDKPQIHKKVDMINALYGNDNLIVTTALPNKLYDAIIYRKPIIVSKGTYLGEVVEKFKIGIAIDVEYDDIKQKIQDFWYNFEVEEFYKNCDELLMMFNEEQKNTIKDILNFVNQ
ncbi:MAG: hypothetical protein PHD05_03570 [Sphaerochaetaceae bacterium]|nr:hypothetical protein [Sphaerochaetaceae bacterium]